IARMKEVYVGETKVLLFKTGPQSFFSTGTSCPHLGAPLSKGTRKNIFSLYSTKINLKLKKGVFHGETILCPWHGASFDIKTGEVIRAPAIDGLASYPG